MKKTLKLTLFLFLMIFSLNVYSQTDYIKYYKNQIDYFENEYSYESHVYQKDIDLCRSSIGYRGIIKKFEKTGNRQYDVLFFNVVNSEYVNVSINYLGKQKPSLEEFEDYKKRKIQSNKNLIKNENDKLNLIKKRKLAKIEYQKKEKIFIKTEQKNLRKRLDSILNNINSHIENSNSYYPVIKYFDSIINRKRHINDKLFFNIPVNYINTFLEDKVGINVSGKNYTIEEIKKWKKRNKGSLPSFKYRVVPIDFICCDRDVWMSYGSSKGYKESNFGDKIETTFTTFRIIQNFRILNEMGLDDSYRNQALYLNKMFLFKKLIEKERLFELLNNQIKYFNYQDIDTLGFSDTGKFKWVGQYKDYGYKEKETVFSLPVVSQLFEWYEDSFNLIEKKGLKYDKFLKEEMPSGEGFEHIQKKQPPEYILKKIYKQFAEMISFISYFESFDFFRIGDKSMLPDYRTAFKNIRSIVDKFKMIKEFDDFIILDFKPLFAERTEKTSYGGGVLKANKIKQIKKIYDQINQRLDKTGKTIHFNLIGNYSNYLEESPIKFFHGPLNYGERGVESREFRIQNLYEFFNFIDKNELTSFDLSIYIEDMKAIINEFK